MAKFKMGVVLDLAETQTARLADGAASSATQLDKEDNGKFVKLVGDSQYGLCAVGDKIQAVVSVANDIAPADGFNLGAIVNNKRARIKVTLDGLEATPGVGAVAVGDYVVAGTVTARGTILPGPPKVCKATNQPGAAVTAADNLVATVNAAIAKVVDAQVNQNFGWRVVSLVGTTAVGQLAIIERV